MDTPTPGPNCGQAGYLKAISPCHGKAANFLVFLEAVKTRLVECSTECGPYPLFSSVVLP